MDARWTRPRIGLGHGPPVGAALGEHLGALGVVGHPGHVRPDEHEVGVVGTVGGHRDEPREHAGHVLEPVPPAHLDHEPGVVGRRRTVGDEVGVAPDGARGAVAALEVDRARPDRRR